MAYSNDLRMLVVKCYEDGEGSTRTLEKRFRISRSTIEDWISLSRQTGSVEKRPHGGGAERKLTKEVLELIKEIIEKQNDLTDEEIRCILEEEHSVVISRATVNKGVHELGLSRKKNSSMTPKETKNTSKKNEKSFSSK